MLLVIGILLLGEAIAVPNDTLDHPDRVISLPGAPLEPSFPIYAGFLQAVDNDTDHKLFYMLTEAIHVDPLTAPLVIWMNGGPGASSLFGAFLENGPYLFNAENGELQYNDFSWNQYANVLCLETPSGVGFSHSNNNISRYDDISTGRVNRKALQDFMTRVHPRYENRDFYITGESYAGVFIPYFAREILENVNSGEFTNRNLKGIAMGNAAVAFYSMNIASAIHLYGMGLIQQKFGKELFEAWEDILVNEKHANYSLSQELEDEMSRLNEEIKFPQAYNILLQCNENANESAWHVSKSVPSGECDPFGEITTYMNREDVQLSLNARTKDDQLVEWNGLNLNVTSHYTRDIDAVSIFPNIFDSVQDNLRILYFTGDMDMMCPPLQVYFGAGRIARDNAMVQVANVSSWRYLNDLGGALSSYTSPNGRISLDVLTVRGAGHMVPISQPDRAFQLINNFISTQAGTEVDYSKMISRKNI